MNIRLSPRGLFHARDIGSYLAYGGFDDLTEEERAAIVKARRQAIDNDRYPLSPRLKAFNTALAKLDPASVPRTRVERPRYQRRQQ